MTNPTDKLFCANHPNTETLLRCNRCEKPICIKCALQTPTGYRCQDCVSGQQKIFETAKGIDLPIAFVVAAVISFIGSLIAGSMGFFVIFIAPIAGTIIAEAVRFATQRRRSKQLTQIVMAGIILGGLPLPLLNLLQFFIFFMPNSESFFMGTGSLFGIIWQGVYLATATTTAYYRLKGIVLNR